MQQNGSKKDRRHQVILDTLETNSAVRIGELAGMLGVSAETIRRDLQELEDKGEICRTYGGAVRNLVAEPILAERLTVNYEERKRVTFEAVEHIGDADHIFLCGGSTAMHFARALVETLRRDLTVLTISIGVAEELSRSPHIQTMLLPGIFDAKERVVYGPETIAAIEKYHPPLTIMSASALDHLGLSEAILVYAHTHAAMIQHSERTLVMIESLKFGRRALTQIATWNPRMHLVTDTMRDERIRTAIEEAGARITTADHPALGAPLRAGQGG